MVYFLSSYKNMKELRSKWLFRGESSDKEPPWCAHKKLGDPRVRTINEHVRKGSEDSPYLSATSSISIAILKHSIGSFNSHGGKNKKYEKAFVHPVRKKTLLIDPNHESFSKEDGKSRIHDCSTYVSATREGLSEQDFTNPLADREYLIEEEISGEAAVVIPPIVCDMMCAIDQRAILGTEGMVGSDKSIKYAVLTTKLEKVKRQIYFMRSDLPKAKIEDDKLDRYNDLLGGDLTSKGQSELEEIEKSFTEVYTLCPELNVIDRAIKMLRNKVYSISNKEEQKEFDVELFSKVVSDFYEIFSEEEIKFLDELFFSKENESNEKFIVNEQNNFEKNLTNCRINNRITESMEKLLNVVCEIVFDKDLREQMLDIIKQIPMSDKERKFCGCYYEKMCSMPDTAIEMELFGDTAPDIDDKKERIELIGETGTDIAEGIRNQLIIKIFESENLQNFLLKQMREFGLEYDAEKIEEAFKGKAFNFTIFPKAGYVSSTKKDSFEVRDTIGAGLHIDYRKKNKKLKDKNKKLVYDVGNLDGKLIPIYIEDYRKGMMGEIYYFDGEQKIESKKIYLAECYRKTKSIKEYIKDRDTGERRYFSDIGRKQRLGKREVALEAPVAPEASGGAPGVDKLGQKAVKETTPGERHDVGDGTGIVQENNLNIDHK